MEVHLVVEVDTLKWYSPRTAESEPQLLGVIMLACANVHGDVARLHGKPSPVLDIEVVRPTSKSMSMSTSTLTLLTAPPTTMTKKLVLEFGALELMHEWWCELATAQHLARRLRFERGDSDGGEPDWEDDEMASSPRAASLTMMAPGGLRGGSSSSSSSGSRDISLAPSEVVQRRPETGRIVDVSEASAVRKAYEEVLKMIIRPPRARYSAQKLGPQRFIYGDGVVAREDFSVTNARGLRVEASIWRDWRRSAAPTVVYCHGNASCRLEALGALTLCLAIGASLCAIDCAGSGQSEGDYVSLGFYEAEDVVAVVQHLRLGLGIHRYALWGRSMGAVTALLYASGKSPDAAALVVDSPFSSLRQLCRDLVHKVSARIPSAAVSMAIRQIRASVKYRAIFDLSAVDPLKRVVSCSTPALFVHGAADDFIAPSHSDAVFAAYGGATKTLLMVPDSNHNAIRPLDVFKHIEAFLRLHLLGDAYAADPTRPSPADLIVDPAVTHPFQVPPWAFTDGEPLKGVDARYVNHAKLQAAKARRNEGTKATSRAAAPAGGGQQQQAGCRHRPPNDDDANNPAAENAEFVSGMSDDRQRAVEAGIGNFFGGAGRDGRGEE